MEAEQWSEAQQKALEAAIKSHPQQTSGETDRWAAIAGCVEGKTKKQCVARVKQIKKAMLQRVPDKAPSSTLAVVHTEGEMIVREGPSWRGLYIGDRCHSILHLRDGAPCHSHIALQQRQLGVVLAATWLRTLHYDKAARADREAAVQWVLPKVLLLGLQIDLLMAPSAQTLSQRAIDAEVTVIEAMPNTLQIAQQFFGLDLRIRSAAAAAEADLDCDDNEDRTMEVLCGNVLEILDDQALQDFRIVVVDADNVASPGELLTKLACVLTADKPSLILSYFHSSTGEGDQTAQCYARCFDFVYTLKCGLASGVVLAAFVNIELEVDKGREEAYIDAFFKVVSKGDAAVCDASTGQVATLQFNIQRLTSTPNESKTD